MRHAHRHPKFPLVVSSVCRVLLPFVTFRSDQSLKLQSETKVRDIINMLNILNHVSDRSSHLTGKPRKNFQRSVRDGYYTAISYDIRVVSVLDSGAEGPGFTSQPRRCRVTVLGKLFTPIVPLLTKQQNW